MTVSLTENSIFMPQSFQVLEANIGENSADYKIQDNICSGIVNMIFQEAGNIYNG